MTMPAIAEEPFKVLDGRIQEAKRQMISGSCGGNTPEERYIAYRVKVDLCTELMRVRQALEKAFTEDEDETGESE